MVGIGASAGGLDALRQLFSTMPADCGMAFVVVQHLSPDHVSVMDELLGKYTQLPVAVASNEVSVEPGKIYLIPPRAEMIISCGRLLLTDRDARQSVFLPIDSFFRALGDDLGPRAVAVVLSGTGSDGSRGIRAVHAAGGTVMAQDLDSAEFSSMPRTAIDTGVVDVVGTLDVLRSELLALSATGLLDTTSLSPPLESMFDVLRHETGVDFSQ
ncbi:MAG: chemotaxis protein CheB, partial [Myxococcota bacterium]